MDRTELWTDIKQGSLYGALHRMAAEGVIEVVRTEQEGGMPSRTVYQLTEAGREELVAIRDRVLRETSLRPDPVDLALSNSQDMTEERLAAVLDGRRSAIAAEIAKFRELRVAGAPYMNKIEILILSHTQLRLRGRADLARRDHQGAARRVRRFGRDPRVLGVPAGSGRVSPRAARRSPAGSSG